MSREPTAASPEVFVDIDDLGRTEYYHLNCGKVWYEKQGVDSPNFCPECGEELFTDDYDPKRHSEKDEIDS